MKSLVIYDSTFGNTKIIAETISQNLGNDSLVLSISEINEINYQDFDLIIVGSPIIGWRPTIKMQEFLSKLQPNSLKGISATSFDTRVKLFIHGDAANKIATKLTHLGASIITKPHPFYVKVKDQETHLLDGEIEKAKQWSKQIIELIPEK